MTKKQGVAPTSSGEGIRFLYGFLKPWGDPHPWLSRRTWRDELTTGSGPASTVSPRHKVELWRKSHIALGVGLSACQKRLSGAFATVATIAYALIEARDERRFLLRAP